MKALLCILAVLALTLPATAMTTDSLSVVKMITDSHQLQIDRTQKAPGDWKSSEHPYVHVAGVEGLVGGFIDFDEASVGRMSDGTQVMAIPLVSGGSGGVFTQLIFSQSYDATPKYVGYIDSGGHLAVNVTYHNIVAVSPNYGPNDQNCCPTKFDTRTYSIVAGKLKLLSTRTSKTP